jgi:hypothetical protein
MDMIEGVVMLGLGSFIGVRGQTEKFKVDKMDIKWGSRWT